MMRHTLLIPLVGPMQAWGSRSRFDDRDTHPEPTKSGVIGLVCAALGQPRDADLSTLGGLRFGVRADAPGRAMTDFHTAQNVVKAGGGLTNVTSQRHYLADACFLAGLEGGDLTLLQKIEAALQNPVWPLSLGRKSFALALPPFLPGGSIREDLSLKEALTLEPWLTLRQREKMPKFLRPERLRLVWEDSDGEGVLSDQPESFFARRFGLRRVRTATIDLPSEETPWFIYPN